MISLIKTLFRFIAKLFSWTRSLLLNLFLLFIVIAIIEGLASAPAIEIPNNSVLVLSPSGVLVDQDSYQPNLMDMLDGGPERPPETVLSELIEAIHFAKDDKQISGLILELDWLQHASISKAEELGQAIEHFKQSGKPVIAYADILDQQRFLIASYADEIYINPMGGVYLTGFGIYRNYFFSAAEKIALRFHVFRSGKYKDAVEPFMRDDMSSQSREHLSTWLDETWQHYTGIIEQQRNLEAGKVNRVAQELDQQMTHYHGDAALLAMENGLVDGALGRLQLKKMLHERFGVIDDELNAISMYDYLANPLLNHPTESKQKIGLIYATGNIVDGYQTEAGIGGDSLSELIINAREDDDILALVLRVDSGGGSAFASEVIREQLQATRDAGKKVYISMGSAAASGGYWIATAADEIWATPTTITGSIGVFGLVPNFSGSLNKMGVYSDGVGTTPFADSFHLDREMSPQTQTLIQAGVDNTYNKFLNLVAISRQRSTEQINEIAQGHIWSGAQALELGLVDQVGGLYDLLDKVKKEYDLHGDAVSVIKRPLSPHEELMLAIMEQVSSGFFGVRMFNQDTQRALGFAQNLTSLLPPLALQNMHINAQSKGIFAQCLLCQHAP